MELLQHKRVQTRITDYCIYVNLTCTQFFRENNNKKAQFTFTECKIYSSSIDFPSVTKFHAHSGSLSWQAVILTSLTS